MKIHKILKFFSIFLILLVSVYSNYSNSNLSNKLRNSQFLNLKDDEKKDKNTLDYISIVLGWIYFLAWSVSFYGQVIENYRRHSVKGLKFDYEIYNLVGFSSYTVYTIRGYIDENLGTGSVQIQDIFFAGHAVLLTIVTIIQIIHYYDKNDKEQRVSHICITILLVMIWGAILLVILESVLNYYDPHITKDKKYIFNSLVYMGWCKVFISLIKYIPQAHSNYKRKSTIGWNIHNILLDFTGGIFSFAQNVVDSINDNYDITPESQPKGLNIAKFALSFVSIFFDILFMVQHYCLYKNSNSDLGDRRNIVNDTINPTVNDTTNLLGSVAHVEASGEIDFVENDEIKKDTPLIDN